MQLIERISLIKAVQNLLPDCHLIIEAQAGYGKSVFLRQLISYLPHAVYLPITQDDEDVAVLRKRVRLAKAKVILLDDVHLLPKGSESVEWLLAQLNGVDHQWVVAGRYLPFTMTAFDEQALIEHWGQEKLTFSVQTTSHLLKDGTATMWQERLAGWPLGIGLVQQLPPAQRQQAVVEGQLFDYLAGTLFDQLPRSQQQFLHTTAVPLHFNDALATHLLPFSADRCGELRREVEQRNLFITVDGQGEFRYHDLFRQFLIGGQGEGECRHIAQQTIEFHIANDNPPFAIEQALVANLHQFAVPLLRDIDWGYLHNQLRYRTFVRWVESLEPTVRDTTPQLYWMAGHCLTYLTDRETEAYRYFERSEALALEMGDSETAHVARYEHINLTYLHDTATEALIAELQKLALVANPHSQASGLRILRVLSAMQAELAHFSEAKVTWHIAYKAAVVIAPSDMLLHMMKQRYAMNILIPMGEFVEAENIFKEASAYTVDNPGNHIDVLSGYCEYYLAVGAWEQLRKSVAQISDLVAEMDDKPSYMLHWHTYYQAMLAIAERRFDAAQGLIGMMMEEENRSLAALEIMIATVWRWRRMGENAQIPDVFDKGVIKEGSPPYQSAWLSLERDVALGLQAVATGQTYELSPETFKLYSYRTHAHLMRVRALVVVLRYGAKDSRWRRFARIVLRQLKQPHYWQLLTQRDPELGVQFWHVLLVERMATEQAKKGLVEIGLIEPLLPLLAGACGVVGGESAGILAQIGNEKAMPALNKAITKAKEPALKTSLVQALHTLETLPPPPLHVNLMGGFQVRRGDTEINDFYRPIVARLLQYFVIHQGQAIPRDRILEDLWCDKPPAKAWATFRTVYSRLRTILEPYMGRKGQNRYVATDGECYRFDPHNWVVVDSNLFFQAVTAPNIAIDDLIAHLDTYRPILPDLPYADWLLHLREKMQETYLGGCLTVGQALLARGDFGEAQVWGQRVLTIAPWMETAHQLLIRSYARQGLRSSALRAYTEAEVVLRQELAVEPSPLTQWLYSRLQAGEMV